MERTTAASAPISPNADPGQPSATGSLLIFVYYSDILFFERLYC